MQDLSSLAIKLPIFDLDVFLSDPDLNQNPKVKNLKFCLQCQKLSYQSVFRSVE